MTDPGNTNRPYLPGITLLSLTAIVMSMLVMGIIIQVVEVLLSIDYTAEHTLAIPAIAVFVALSLTTGLAAVATRRSVLSRPERLCVLFAMLVGAPLMTQGFWHRIVAITSTIPSKGDFEKIDAFSDRFWPHGSNLLAGAMAPGDRPDRKTLGRVRWHETTIGDGRTITAPLLENDRPEQTSAVQIRLDLVSPGRDALRPGEPYLASVLARAQGLGPGALYFCRIRRDEEPTYVEAFHSSTPRQVTYLHKQGFVRVGLYGVKLPVEIRRCVWVEFGLTGAGRVELADPKLMNVSALTWAYSGKELIRQSDYHRLPPDQRTGLIVRPDSLWSWRGVKFLLSGYIPLRDWAGPVLTWSAFVLLVLLATLAMNVIMRRQWVDNERYQLPITKVPIALLGAPGEPESPVPAIWRSRVMWAGFATALAWCLLRGWNFYDPNVPDVGVHVAMKDFFSAPSWGKTFDNVNFEVFAIFVALASFMELNVLGSLLVGFALYRAQNWFGEFTGLAREEGFPYSNQQQVAAYVTYALLVIVFSRKHLRRVLSEAVFGRSAASAGEMFSYRTALILLLGTFAGIVGWGVWVGVSPWGMATLFLFLLCLGLVTAKVRAECGTPFGYFAVWNAALFLSMMGGMTLFGPNMMLMALVASFFLCETVFFVIPGAQLELIELGRRYRVVPRHLLYTCLLGLAGGLIVGGWVFLSNAYSLGGESVKYRWAFEEKPWYFFQFNKELQEATNAHLGRAADQAAEAVPPQTFAYAYAATVTAGATVLRQVFAGFWFHPLGFILGMTRIMDYIWGSVLVALLVRSAVLWFGGAATVRNKLVPFFIGVFLGAVTSAVVWDLYALYLYGQNVERVYGAIP